MPSPSLVVLAALSLAVATGAGSARVRWSGTLRAVHAGDAAATIDLAAVDARHLYAVGALAGRGGEITVLDGAVHVARVANGAVVTSHERSAPAALLVWTEVAAWSPRSPLGSAAATHAELERAVEAAARRAGVDTSAPFPFLLEGVFSSVDLHVLVPKGPAPAGGGPHGPSHAVRLASARGTAIGFFSRAHGGTITHHGSHAHLHLVATDGASGHVDEIAVGPDVRISFPAPE